jgi:poly-gamma-glutamate synthesis protein (capsule biosynthesis protein)
VIHGTGDVALDPSYIPALAFNGWDHAWSGLDGLFVDDDLTVINLECVPSDIGAPLNKAFTFRCPTEALPSLSVNGIDVANMGNNHSGDFGKDALVDGRAQLFAADVGAVGAGKDLDEAGEAALFWVKGWKIAVVGFGGVAPSPSWYATEDQAGMRSGDDIDQMVEAVAAAKEIADIVIVTIHWGKELDTTPRADDIERANAMVEAGADIIFGHHPHRMQPLEMVDGAAVFWSLGNFVWPHNSIPSATTAVARAVVHPDGTIEACLIPAFIETHGRPVLTAEPECGPEL